MTPGREQRLLYALVFVVGMASLGAEISAARLMSPYFGASTIVWANTIAVVLVSLSAGYWLGGRLGDDHPHLRGLCAMVAGAAVLLAVVPFAARPFLSVSADALDSVSAGAFLGSLVAVLCLVAVPVVLLGACSPYAIRLAVPDVQHSGRVAGRLYALSTAGSLTGTMLAALVLIPFAGTQRTFLVFAVALSAVAVAGLGWRLSAVPVALAGALALPVGLPGGEEVVFETESEYQHIRVVRGPGGERDLTLNEGVAVHSTYTPGRWLTGGYWDPMVVLPFAARERPPGRVAILGNAGGTSARQLGHFFPRARVDGVEIDPELTEVGYRYFDMGANPRLTVHAEDARPWLRAADDRYDVILLDAYRQPYVPFYLATREFFALARDRLSPNGVLVVNVGHPDSSDELERVIAATMGSAFPFVRRDPAEDTNTLLVGAANPISRARLARVADDLPPGLGAVARASAERLEPALRGGDVYTDDRAPVEWLIDSSLLDYAAEQ